MKPKKTERANLEPKRKRFFVIGSTIALAITLAAFEWGVPIENTQVFPEPITTCGVEVYPPVTWTKTTEIEPIVFKKPNSFEIEIVEDFVEPSDEPVGEEIPDIEVPEGTIINIEEKEHKEVEPIYDYVDVDPSYMCSENSEAEMMKYFAKNIKYPALARDNGIQGTVIVQFVVDKKGKMKDVQVLREVAGGCTEEAVRVVQSMNEWCPGKNHGIPVSVRYKVPIKFTLN